MFIEILFLYFINFIVLFCFGRYMGALGSVIVVMYNLTLSLLGVIWYFILGLKSNGIYIFDSSFSLINIGIISINWNFIIDNITQIMLLVVCIVSYLVHIYSINYMRLDPHFIRFLSLLSLFTFCMLLLISSNNFIQLFFGWEGVGLCSYLLVNFWFTRIQANKAAMKAMLVNRLGDISLLIAISLYYYVFRSMDFSVGNLLVESYKYSYISFIYMEWHYISLLSFFLLLAAVGKSAQLGLHTWLPDAMEGPTPVSALIHAATMVTAGVFIILRLSIVFEHSFLSVLILVFGSFTALFGSLVAIVQNDIKKVVAYSTCSQLGYMVVACGLYKYELALFHLFNHAFFKALLFLSAGMVLHGLQNEQDMRKMGGLFNILPVVYVSMFIASYALMGLPFLSGFYSKDLILEVAYYYYDLSIYVSFMFLIMAAFFTACYSMRMIFLVFFDEPRGFIGSYVKMHDIDQEILIIFLILSVLSLFSGYWFKDLLVGVGSYYISVNVMPNLFYNIYYDSELLNYKYKLLPLIATLFGLYLGYSIMCIESFLEELTVVRFYRFLSNKWNFDIIYNKSVVDHVLKYSYSKSFKLLDKNLFELLGSKGSYFIVNNSALIYNYFYGSGYIYLTIFLLLISLVVILLLLMLITIKKPFIILLLYFYIMFYVNRQFSINFKEDINYLKKIETK